MDLETGVQSNLLQWPKRLVSVPDLNTVLTLSHLLQTDFILDSFSYNLPKVPNDQALDLNPRY